MPDPKHTYQLTNAIGQVESATVYANWLRDRPRDLCIGCHNGITGANIAGLLNQRSGHQSNPYIDRHDPDEDPRVMRPHVECVDCHNPHAARSDPLGLLGAPLGIRNPSHMPTMENVPGVSLSGAPVPDARFYYEVCFRCHGDSPVPSRDRIVRDRDTFGNVRRQFLPSAASAHPVTFASRRDGDSPSLLPQYRTGGTISCQDCHNNPDARELGGGGPNGPHGSRYPFLLADRYETSAFVTETPQAYALCYRCHDRNSILADESFSLHNVHVVRGRASCSACHSPHGVNGSATEHDHLINFDLSVVAGRREYRDLGRFSGSCTLTCHGVNHVNFQYSR
ncbi:MAG: hypothetical protein JNG88_08695 [Phycisphaerales bacterium]|nr:hypothetical protein [Phycisphaerales bacterium]